jgi:hypothetical protein
MPIVANNARWLKGSLRSGALATYTRDGNDAGKALPLESRVHRNPW